MENFIKRGFFTLAILTFSFFVSISLVRAVQEISLDEVSKHDSPGDCYMVYDDKVYDLSDYIPDHDRYLDIRDWCGKDMTEDFETKAGLSRDHKRSSYALLENYYIGDLSEIQNSNEELSVSDNNNSEDENDEEHDDHDEEDELYSVEISGQELKELTIKEIADLWDIDADTLLDGIIDEFNLSGDYTTDQLLDELRDEYKFSPSQIKDIAEEIKTGEAPTTDDSSSSNSTEKITPNNPYHLLLPLLGSAFLYIGFYFLAHKTEYGKKYKLLSRNVFNMFWNTVLLITLIPAAGFGIFMVIRYSVTDLYAIDFDFTYWHVEGSIIMGTIATLHLITRLKIYLGQIKLLAK